MFQKSVIKLVKYLIRVEQYLSHPLDLILQILAFILQLFILMNDVRYFLPRPDIDLKLSELFPQLLIILRVLLHYELYLHPFFLFGLHMRLSFF